MKVLEVLVFDTSRTFFAKTCHELFSCCCFELRSREVFVQGVVSIDLIRAQIFLFLYNRVYNEGLELCKVAIIYPPRTYPWRTMYVTVEPEVWDFVINFDVKFWGFVILALSTFVLIWYSESPINNMQEPMELSWQNSS